MSRSSLPALGPASRSIPQAALRAGQRTSRPPPPALTSDLPLGGDPPRRVALITAGGGLMPMSPRAGLLNPKLLVAIALMVLGGSGLAFGTFSAGVQPSLQRLAELDLAAGGQEPVQLPVWAGVFALVVGGLVLVAPARRA